MHQSRTQGPGERRCEEAHHRELQHSGQGKSVGGDLCELQLQRGEHRKACCPKLANGRLNPAGIHDAHHCQRHLAFREIRCAKLLDICNAVLVIVESFVPDICCPNHGNLLLEVLDLVVQRLAAHGAEGLDSSNEGHKGAAEEAEHEANDRLELVSRQGEVGSIDRPVELHVAHRKVAQNRQGQFQDGRQRSQSSCQLWRRRISHACSHVNVALGTRSPLRRSACVACVL
mmetsp:Transcript_73488/g.132354  ORF Transcript_73488/g.132354 Transcript_73488/m.132354 type:complete len:230 (-) Transcript_73488:163-852(-)